MAHRRAQRLRRDQKASLARGDHRGLDGDHPAPPRRRLAQRRATVRAKLKAHGLLEQRVTERTIDLIAANERLACEIEQRRTAEANLRQTQDELIQAGKLAALGHMSAAVSHEINQPLTALRTYVSSTSKLLRQGQWKIAAQNITRMDALLIRMADITGHLRRFARSETSETGFCEIRSAVRNALDLLHARLQERKVEVFISQPDNPVFVRGAENRLEQVLINLLNNASTRWNMRPSAGSPSVSAKTEKRPASRWRIPAVAYRPSIRG
ncbi:MAG: hypothetical protein HC850_15755 [Rhodomicrobium sp.]|nr:hypothetical protein [Rhodomicrobium sp.]